MVENSTLAIARIATFGKDDKIRFTIGGGSGTAGTHNGVLVQDTVGPAYFTVKSDGEGDDVFEPLSGTVAYDDTQMRRNPHKVGRLYEGDTEGKLKVRVTSATDGGGKAMVDTMKVRAGSKVKLTFTYNPSQTIEDGELQFIVPLGWSKPQVEDIGKAGYTEVIGAGNIGSADDDENYTVTVPINSLQKGQKITVTYGASDAGKAVASKATSPAIPSRLR